MGSDPGDQSFERLLQALGPSLPEILIIGGWAHRLYRYRPEVIVPSHEPLFTTDTDIAIPPGAALPPKQLLEQLRSHGFVEEFFGEENPPVTHYRLGKEDSAFYAEFLTPLFGGEDRRGKSTGSTIDLGGVVAQRLRHLEILLIDPWSIKVTDSSSQAADPISVRLPNAVAYIAQKLLILRKRKPSERAKDLLYIHDTIELFGAALESLAALWQTTVRPRLDRIADEIQRLAHTQFSEVTDDIRSSSRAARASGRELDPEIIRLRCAVGLAAIFSETMKL